METAERSGFVANESGFDLDEVEVLSHGLALDPFDFLSVNFPSLPSQSDAGEPFVGSNFDSTTVQWHSARDATDGDSGTVSNPPSNDFILTSMIVNPQDTVMRSEPFTNNNRLPSIGTLDNIAGERLLTQISSVDMLGQPSAIATGSPLLQPPIQRAEAPLPILSTNSSKP